MAKPTPSPVPAADSSTLSPDALESSQQSPKSSISSKNPPPLPSVPARAADGTLLQVALDKLDDNPYQPRRQLDESALKELVASIREHGLLQAITVCRDGDRWQIIAGHRRVAAFKRLRDESKTNEDRQKFSTIPAQERVAVTEQQKAVFALVENLQREDLNPLEAAVALARLQTLAGLSGAREVAEATGIREDRVKRLLRLSEAPQAVKDAVASGFLVTLLESDGTPIKTDGGKERRERRQLDLMCALQFAKLHKHWEAKSPKHADERTSRAIERALQEGWAFRKVQEHITHVIERPEESETPSTGAELPPRPSAFRADARKLVVRLDLLERMDVSQRSELAQLLSGLLRKLEAGSPAA